MSTHQQLIASQPHQQHPATIDCPIVMRSVPKAAVGSSSSSSKNTVISLTKSLLAKAAPATSQLQLLLVSANTPISGHRFYNQLRQYCANRRLRYVNRIRQIQAKGPGCLNTNCCHRHVELHTLSNRTSSSRSKSSRRWSERCVHVCSGEYVCQREDVLNKLVIPRFIEKAIVLFVELLEMCLNPQNAVEL